MDEVERFMNGVKRRSPGQPEFYQAVEEVVRSILPYLNKLQDPRFKKVSILERMTEPDRIIIFRVCWEDDDGWISCKVIVLNATNRIWCRKIRHVSAGSFK